MKTDTPCPHCNGVQWIYETREDIVIPKRCICLEKQLLKEYLGPDIDGDKWVKSELYTEEKDLTQDNLFIKGSWEAICQHLRWVLSAKKAYNSEFCFRLITDSKLIQVWLGAESYIHRPKEVREEIETFNSLDDLLSDPTLVIIRLGFRGRNKAMPDVFYDALKVREKKPTWIIEGPIPFTYGHNTYSPKVWKYITEKFKIVNLGGDVEAERQLLQNSVEETSKSTVSLDADAPRAEDFYEAEKVVDDDANLYNLKSKPKWSKWKKKWGGGGGDF